MRSPSARFCASSAARPGLRRVDDRPHVVDHHALAVTEGSPAHVLSPDEVEVVRRSRSDGLAVDGEGEGAGADRAHGLDEAVDPVNDLRSEVAPVACVKAATARHVVPSADVWIATSSVPVPAVTASVSRAVPRSPSSMTGDVNVDGIRRGHHEPARLRVRELPVCLVVAVLLHGRRPSGQSGECSQHRARFSHVQLRVAEELRRVGAVEILARRVPGGRELRVRREVDGERRARLAVLLRAVGRGERLDLDA
jgi:hypothetical protein